MEASRVAYAEDLALADRQAKELFASGHRGKAYPWLQESLSYRVRTLGPEHRDTIENRNLLGRACRAAGRHQEAMQLYKQNLEILLRTLGQDDADTLWGQSRLANCYYAAGRFQDALKLFQKTFEARKRTLDADHPDTLRSRSSLANCCLWDRLKAPCDSTGPYWPTGSGCWGLYTLEPTPAETGWRRR
ncbi:MAG: hypothetical protein BZY75_03600 [SAR202 cluster bacterium Io17-Chloro-G7]|nr:MAG: hypothetical protein BZY75_03600 [SAR202 cluster bacterium Io17-Chloro-G7]